MEGVALEFHSRWQVKSPADFLKLIGSFPLQPAPEALGGLELEVLCCVCIAQLLRMYRPIVAYVSPNCCVCIAQLLMCIAPLLRYTA